VTKVDRLGHRFVEFVPRDLEFGVLYVSIAYATAVHACACGCGNRVVTPLTPSDWQLTFDGETVSLSPSIGNWSFACQSHYWIRRDQVRWARRWSPAEIDRGRQRSRAATERRIDPGMEAPAEPSPERLWGRVGTHLRKVFH
jgi:hypothetical protein